VTPLTLMSRAYCHLCHEMELALRPLAAEFGFEIAVLDVDADAELERRFGELVPVLLHEETELCHYHLDDAKVRAYLSTIR
jgi:thioredoxin reductase (NADPH)